MSNADRELLERELAADAAERRSWVTFGQKAAMWVLLVFGLLALGRGAVDLIPLLQGLLP